jgi:hypothetical protein
VSGSWSSSIDFLVHDRPDFPRPRVDAYCRGTLESSGAQDRAGMKDEEQDSRSVHFLTEPREDGSKRPRFYRMAKENQTTPNPLSRPRPVPCDADISLTDWVHERLIRRPRWNTSSRK